MQAARLARTAGDELVFLIGPEGEVSVTNRTTAGRTVRVRLTRAGAGDALAERHLGPGASWTQRWPPDGRRD